MSDQFSGYLVIQISKMSATFESLQQHCWERDTDRL